MSRFLLGRVSKAIGFCRVSFYLMIGVFVFQGGIGFDHRADSRATQNSVVTVSAASFESGALAPESIVSAYGVALATSTQIANASPLPTTLAGTTVRVKDSRGAERSAPLFFVSPGQINYQIPPGTATGIASINVTSGNGTVSTGLMQIAAAAPGLFTANASGQGAPAATIFRLKANGEQSFEPTTRSDSVTGQVMPLPIDLGAEGDQVFLLLFGTGFKFNGGLANVKVRIGGVEAEVSYADAAPGFTGLDQANVRLPRGLIGSGRVTLSLGVNGFSASNLVELEIAGAPGSAPPQINGYSAASVLAGQLLTINGAGFSPNAADNLVRIGSLEARVVSASATQLTIRVPFGAAADVVSVRTPRGEGRGANALQMRTSISGVVEDTRRQPLAGVKIRVAETGIEFTTGAEGSFLLPDVPPAVGHFVEFDGGAVPGTLPYPKVILKMRVQGNRDNQMDAPVALQQITGPGAQVGGSSLTANQAAIAAKLQQTPTAQTLRVGEVTFEIPAGAGISLPNGARQGVVNLTVVENSRTPVKLPAALFSQTIPQITPFGAVLLGGGKLTLPNSEAYPPGTLVKLFRLDQTLSSPTLGQFVEAGTATVTANGQRIETAPNAITEITQYFVGAARQTTTVTGRVLDSDGTTPVRQAIVRCRGQETVTDGNGGFVLRNVEANTGDKLSVEATFVRATARVDRVGRINIDAVPGGLTEIKPDLVLPAEGSNRAPVLLAPATLRVNEAETREVNFVAYDPDAGQTIQLSLTGASFATLVNRGNDVYSLRLQTRANDGGRYALSLNATDNQNQSTTLNIALEVNHAPVANPQSVVTDEDTPKPITLTGSDTDGDRLSFAVVNNPLNGRLTGTPPNLTYTPDARYTGTDRFTFKVNDGATDSTPATVTIAINPINRPPVLTVPAAQTVNEGQQLAFTVSANDPNPGQQLTFTATNSPGGASFNQTSNTTARFIWTPSFTQAGSFTVSFRVTDNGVPALSDTKTVTITVNDVNRPPVLTVPGVQTVVAGQNLSFTVSATDPDAGQTATLSAENLPPSASFDPAIGLFSWMPNASQAGTHVVIFKATDNGTPVLSATASLAVTVTIQWSPTTTPIEGGQVNALVSNGTALFAGTLGGVFRSTDSGQSWVAVNTGLTNLSVNALAAIGTNLFAGTDGGGVFRSTDNGNSWASANSGIGNQFVYALTANGATLFAGTNGGGIYRSTDNGQSWSAVNTGLPVAAVRSFAVSGANIFAGIENNGVFLSTNNGQSWTAANTGLPLDVQYTTLAISGLNIFAGTRGGGPGNLYVSTNNGQSWNVVTGAPRTFYSASIVIGTNIFVGASTGIFRSTDNGQSWNQVLSNSTFAFSLNGAGLFAGTADGVYRSVTNGNSWSLGNTRLTAVSSVALAVSGASLFATFGNLSNGRLYRSGDNGQNWLAVTPFPTGSTFVRPLAVSDTNIIAGSDNVYLSADNGQSWRGGTGLPLPPNLNSLAISGTNIFVGTRANGVYRSTDNGNSWEPANAGIGNSPINAIAASGTMLFAGTNGNGIFRSTDNGQNWVAVSSGLPDLFANVIFVSGANLFAGIGTFRGIYRSTNNGNSWAEMNNGLPANTRVSAFAQSGSSVFAATSNGVFVSTNQGQSWMAVSTGLPPSSAISIAVSGNRLFVGLAGSGVYVAQ